MGATETRSKDHTYTSDLCCSHSLGPESIILHHILFIFVYILHVPELECHSIFKSNPIQSNPINICGSLCDTLLQFRSNDCNEQGRLWKIT